MSMTESQKRQGCGCKLCLHLCTYPLVFSTVFHLSSSSLMSPPVLSGILPRSCVACKKGPKQVSSILHIISLGLTDKNTCQVLSHLPLWSQNQVSSTPLIICPVLMIMTTLTIFGIPNENGDNQCQLLKSPRDTCSKIIVLTIFRLLGAGEGSSSLNIKASFIFPSLCNSPGSSSLTRK